MTNTQRFRKLIEIITTKEFRPWSEDSLFTVSRLDIDDKHYIEILEGVPQSSTDTMFALYHKDLYMGEEFNRLELFSFFVGKDGNTMSDSDSLRSVCFFDYIRLLPSAFFNHK